MKTATAHKHGNATDKQFNALLKRLQTSFPDGPLFTTDAEGLWEAYLKTFPVRDRQYHNCNACHYFISRYGGLVSLDENGIVVVPALWDPRDADVDHEDAFAAMYKIVKRAKITGVFLKSDTYLAAPFGSDEWTHFGVRQSKPYKSTPLKNAGQAAAEKLEDFKNVKRALEEFDSKTLATALSLLNSEALYRAEKVIGPATWLSNLIDEVDATLKTRKDNVIWAAVAVAPAGFCHPRSSMIGTLLEDISQGMSFPEVSKRFAAKMSPIAYQRPQAAPKAGNIKRAETIFTTLEAAGALERRFARLDEIDTIWAPSQLRPKQKGIFGDLLPSARGLQVPGGNITWEKFERTALSGASKIELYVPSRSNFTAIVTAVHENAPHIFQWDHPFSWYVYHGGSSASNWRLTAGTWTPVNAVTRGPSEWFGETFTHQGERAIFILNGAQDTQTAGLSLFPEILKSEYREIRSTIEAYSRGKSVQGIGSACGLSLQKGSAIDVRVRVTDAVGTRTEFRIDRWD